MLTNTNAKVQNTEVNTLEASKALMAQLQAKKVMVKPTLLEGYYTIVFQGMNFIETKHKGKDCMAVQIKYMLDTNEYEELFPLDGTASPEAQQAAMGQIERYMKQLGEQFNLLGVDITFDDLNKFIGQTIDMKVYTQEYKFTNTLTNNECKGHARKIGFWKKPIEATQPTQTIEVPKF